MTDNKFNTVEFTRELQKKYASSFCCGNPAIDNFLKSSEAFDCLFGKTYAMMTENEIIGYYNISTGDIEDDDQLRMGGSIYINYFALDQKYHRVKYNENWYVSDLLIMDCINRVLDIQENTVGFTFITLSSTSEGYNLYKRNGFEELEDDMKIAKNQGEFTCIPMYLPLATED